MFVMPLCMGGGGGTMCTVISYDVMQPLSLWEKAALSSDEYVAGRTYRCITNSPFALLCMSG